MKKNYFKKSLSLIMTVVMLMTCWVFVAPTEADAAATNYATAVNTAALNGLTGSTTINTTSGVYFTGDSDAGITSVPNVYQNLIWSGSAQQAALISNQTIQDSNDVEQFAIYYPATVLMYDGSTTPQMGVSILKDSLNKSDSKYQVFHYGTKISSTTDLVIPGDWHTKNEETGSTNPKFYYTWNGGNNQAGLNYTGTKGSSYYAGGTGWHYMSNLIQYKGSLNDTTYSATYTPSFQTYLGRQWTSWGSSKSKEATYTLSCSVPIYVINAKPLKAAYSQLETYKSNITSNPGKYDTASVRKFVELANALMATNPNKYTWSTNTATVVGNYASAAKTAVDNWNAWINAGGLQERNFEVTYDNMFSLADWWNSGSANKANVSVDLAAGKVTVQNTNSSGEYTTPCSGSSSNANTRNTSYYAMPVIGGQEYTIKYTTDHTDTEMFAFFYDANGGCAHADSYGAYNFRVSNGTGQKTFKAPDSATQMEIRFDNNVGGTTANFTNIMVYPASLDLAGVTTRPYRKLYNYNASIGTLDTPVRTGYIFDGWKEDTNGDGIGDAAAPTGNITSSRVVYSTWKPGTMDVGYDNLFSLATWANTKSNGKGNTANTTNIVVDLDAGTIAVSGKSDAYTTYGGGSDQYHIPVTAGETYIFDYDATSTNGTYQQFLFFYNDKGEGVSGALDNGTATTQTHIGHYDGKPITFTVPSGCTQIGLRLGICGDTEGTATYSNIGIYKKSDYDAYAKNYTKVREAFLIGDAKTFITPSRDGYKFVGWTLADGTKVTSTEGFNSNTVIYANWIKLVTVTFEGTGKTVTFDAGSTLTSEHFPDENDQIKEYDDDFEYTFAGWYSGNTEIKVGTPVTEDIVVSPKFNATAHNFEDELVSKATCASPAIFKEVCINENCGYVLVERKEYNGDKEEYKQQKHNFDLNKGAFIDYEATTDSTHTVLCSYYYSRGCKGTEIVAHIYPDAPNKIDGGTCSIKGNNHYFCDDCGHEKVEEGEYAPENHDYDETKGTPNGDGKNHTVACKNDATHTKTVACVDAGSDCKCDICGQVLIHVYDQKTETYPDKVADCYNDATFFYTCKCGAKGTETWTKEGSKLAHDWEDTETFKKSDAVCETGTVYYKECKLCHNSSEDITGDTWTKNDATGHDYTGEVRANDDATHSFLCVNGCGTYGYNKVKDSSTDCTDSDNDCICDTCKQNLEHVYDQKVETYPDKVADCYNNATFFYTCKCGAKGTETWTKTGSKLEHDWANTETFKKSDAVCETGTVYYKECKLCHASSKDITGETWTNNDATGHDYTGEVMTYNNGYHNFLCKNNCGTYGYEGIKNARATCEYKYENTASGTHKATCTVCAYSFTEDCSGGQASCTKLKKCDKCKTEYGVTDPHSFTGTVVQLKGDVHARLCEYCSTEGLYGIDAEEGKTEACSGGDATCSALAVCDVCDDTYGELDVNDHKWGKAVPNTVEDPAKDIHTHTYTCEYNAEHKKSEKCYPTMSGIVSPTCNKEGYTVQVCQDCENTWNTDIVAALGHDWGAWVDNKNGTHTKTCTRGCEYEDNTQTANCADNATADVKDPDCINGGYTTYTCNDCAYTWKDDYTDANGHSFKSMLEKDAYKRSDKSCTVALTYWYKCENCDVSAETISGTVADETTLYWVAKDPLDHKFTAKNTDEKYLASAATCTAKATYYYSCANCGDSSENSTSPETFTDGKVLGHEWVKPADDVLAKYLATPADCITDATYYYVCNRTDCGISSKEVKDGDTWTAENSKTGHDFDHENGYKAYVAPDCENTGVVEHYTCKVCKVNFAGEDATTIVTDTVIPKLGHDMVDIAKKDATCEDDGYTAHEQCSRCGARNYQYKVIGKLGHTYDAEYGYYCDKDNDYHAYGCKNKCGTFGVNGVKYSVTEENGEVVIVGGEHCEFSAEYTQYDIDGVHYHKQTCACGNEIAAECKDSEAEYVDPTCEADGYYVYICDDCSYRWEVVVEESATGHSWPEAWSMADGDKHIKECANCDATQTESCSSTSTEPLDCGEQRLCEKCGDGFGEFVEHKYENIVDEAYIASEATCDSPATYYKTCTNPACKNKVSTETFEDGDVKPHEMSEYVFTVEGWKHSEGFDASILKEPTCGEEGQSISYCANCDHYTLKTELANSDAHTWKYEFKYDENGNLTYDNWETVGGNCGTGITKKNVCTSCGKKMTKTVSVPHTWKVILVQEATCTANGFIELTCAACEASRLLKDTYVLDGVDYAAEYNVVAKGEHSWIKDAPAEGDYMIIDGNVVFVEKYPAYNADGRGYLKCSKCSVTEKVSIDAYGTNPEDHKHPELGANGESTLKYVAQVNPTCTTSGHLGYYECTRCPYSQYMIDHDAFYLAPLGHSDKNNDGDCDDCDKELKGDKTDNCSCICHKESGFMKFIYKILKFFWKLFKTNKTCACGNVHY